jgi:hypothetical protein
MRTEKGEAVKREIVRVDYHDGSDEGLLAYLDEVKDDSHVSILVGNVAPITLEELADFCDQKAEDMNAHEFIGSHRILAAVLYRKLSRWMATEILKEIAEQGGLQGMVGMFKSPTAYADYGITEPWNDWKLGD